MTTSATPQQGASDCVVFSSTERRQAWAIHLLTASGLIVGMLALNNILLGHPRSAMVWLWATQVIDGIDGPIARSYHVKERVPKIDGYVLDLIIDFVTCVIIPAAFIHEFHLLPSRYPLVLTGLVVLSGAIWFSRTDMMTDDHWFRGFPAVWNLAAPTLLLLGTRPWIAAVAVVVLAVCSFTDIPCPHPVRVAQWRKITLPVTVAWLGAMIWLTLIFHRGQQSPPFLHITSPFGLRMLLIAAPLYFVVLAWVRHFDLKPASAVTHVAVGGSNELSQPKSA